MTGCRNAERDHRQPLVSIVIDNYNYERYLACAIESALAQTYDRVEVIVVDDGSTDGSREILRQYEGRAKIIFKVNEGQASTFNEGFAAASGDLILFLDSDDFLDPDAIEAAVARWEDGLTKVHFPLRVVDSTGTRTGLIMPRARLDRGDMKERILRVGRYIASPTSGNLFSRAFLSQVMPIPKSLWHFTGDGYLNTCAPFYGPMEALEEPHGGYRVHDSNATGVAAGGEVNLAQIRKLIRYGLLEKELIEQTALSHGLRASKSAVTSHWMYLKLELTLRRLSKPDRSMRLFSVVLTGWRLIVSALSAPELSSWRKAQLVGWTLAVVITPPQAVSQVVRIAFQTAPAPGLVRRLRQV